MNYTENLRVTLQLLNSVLEIRKLYSMNYNTFSSASELEAIVKCYWTLEIPAAAKPQKQRIVPDGCMEMIFHFGDLYKQYIEDGRSIIQPRSFVFGQITSYLDIEATGATNIFAIRFHPEGFIPYATIAIKEMENKAVSLEKLFGKDGLLLEEKIATATETAEKINVIENFLLERLVATEAVDRMVRSTVETILNINGQLSVDELSQQLNVNRRQLERKFHSVIGLSPKKLSKIIRLQATLKMMINNESASLTSIAHEGDYYDQAHFIKDFKEFTGMSPKNFYADNLKMSSLFYGAE